MKDRDLQTDGEPRFSGHGGAGTAGTTPRGGPPSDREAQGAKEHSATVLAKRVDEYLEKARTDHRFDRLVVVAPPKFLGTLRRELNKDVAKMISEEIPKDLSWLNARELEQHLLRESGRAP